jgi:hypothetical protein
MVTTASYVSIGEFKAAPTAVDAIALMTNGTAEQNTAQLAAVIKRASSWADMIAKQNPLAATSETDRALVRVRRDGYVALVCKFWPVLELTSCSLGPTPSSLVAVDAASGADAYIEASKVIYVPAAWQSGSLRPSFSLGSGVGGKMHALWTYVSGWPHAALGVTTAAGASTLLLSNTTGMYPGTRLEIADVISGYETVTVLAATDATHVTLVAPTTITHTLPTSPDLITVSALPGAVKEATIRLTSAVIKARGNEAIVLASINNPEPNDTISAFPGARQDIVEATRLLQPLGNIG